MVDVLFRLFVTLGSGWVLWILVAASVLSLAVVFDRWRYLRNQERVGSAFWRAHVESWIRKGTDANWRASATAWSERFPCAETELLTVLARPGDIANRTAPFVVSARMRLEKNLSVLGTLGNNAPFIGLFGTVLGIIKAFHDMGGQMAESGIQAVSHGLSEALVATAVGLLVAIPSVLFFNFFQRKVRVITGSRRKSRRPRLREALGWARAIHRRKTT